MIDLAGLDSLILIGRDALAGVRGVLSLTGAPAHVENEGKENLFWLLDCWMMTLSVRVCARLFIFCVCVWCVRVFGVCVCVCLVCDSVLNGNL